MNIQHSKHTLSILALIFSLIACISVSALHEGVADEVSIYTDAVRTSTCPIITSPQLYAPNQIEQIHHHDSDRGRSPVIKEVADSEDKGDYSWLNIFGEINFLEANGSHAIRPWGRIERTNDVIRSNSVEEHLSSWLNAPASHRSYSISNSLVLDTADVNTDRINWAAASRGSVITGQSSNGSGFVVAELIDERNSEFNRWAGVNISGGESFDIDFGQERTIDRVSLRLFDGDDRFFQYRIEASTDGINYASLVDRTDGEHRSVQEISFTPVNVRYVRITGTFTSSSSNFILYDELQISGEQATSPQDPISLTLDGSIDSGASADSGQIVELNAGTYEVSYLDGAVSGWSSDSSNGGRTWEVRIDAEVFGQNRRYQLGFVHDLISRYSTLEDAQAAAEGKSFFLFVPVHSDVSFYFKDASPGDNRGEMNLTITQLTGPTTDLSARVKDAMTRSVMWEQVDVAAWDTGIDNGSNTCFGCHIQSQAMAGLAISAEKLPELPVEEALEQELVSSYLGWQDFAGFVSPRHGSNFRATQTSLWSWSASTLEGEAYVRIAPALVNAIEYLLTREDGSGGWAADHSEGVGLYFDGVPSATHTSGNIQAIAKLLNGPDTVPFPTATVAGDQSRFDRNPGSRFTATFDTVEDVTAIRVSIADSYTSNGNFVLNELEVLNQSSSITIVNTQANFEQSGFPISETVDGESQDSNNGWAYGPMDVRTDPAVGLWQFDLPSSIDSVSFWQTRDDDHQIRQLKVEYTTDASPDLATGNWTIVPNLSMGRRVNKPSKLAALTRAADRFSSPGWDFDRNMRSAAQTMIGLTAAKPYLTGQSLVDADARIEETDSFLRTAQRADGGWQPAGQDGSRPLVTAQVMIALLRGTTVTDDPVILTGAEYLLGQQQINGAWNSPPTARQLAATTWVEIALPFIFEQLTTLPPTAVATAAPTPATIGQVITLDGSASFDNDAISGDLIPQYFWDFDIATDSDNDGDPANDVDGEGAVTGFVAQQSGTFTVGLTYVDDDGEAATTTTEIVIGVRMCDADFDTDIDQDDIAIIFDSRNTSSSGAEDPRDPDQDSVITVLDARQCAVLCDSVNCEPIPSNAPPTADAGIDQLVDWGATVQLNALSSMDPDGDTLTYAWELLTQPAGSMAVLDSVTSGTPQFVSDAPGIYILRLDASDSQSSGVPDAIVVKVNPLLVPDVVGSSQADAEAEIAAAGLVVGDITMEPNLLVPAGNIISQDPLAGLGVALGSAVNLVVSLGPSLVQVPDVIGLSLSSAETMITDADLVVGNITFETSTTVPDGNVISQSPAGGENVTAGTSVDLVVSSGLPSVVVPDVVGLTQAAAEAAITGDGLVVGSVTTMASASVPAGQVISQDPLAGVSVLWGTAVDLVISSGPDPVNVPDVVGLSLSAATMLIEGADLVVGTVTEQSSTTVPFGQVISQDPVAGTNVAIGSAVNLVISTGPPDATVPGVVGQTQSMAEMAIMKAGLILGSVTGQFSDTVPLGQVISQDPVGGVLVPLGSAVNLVISQGPPPFDEQLPELSADMDRAPASYVQGETATLFVEASDDSGSVTVTATLDGLPLMLTLPATGIDTSLMAIGSVHSILVVAEDPSGNTRSATVAFAIQDPADTTPPIAEITSPVFSEEITAPRDVIGTASDDNLLSYVITLQPTTRDSFGNIIPNESVSVIDEGFGPVVDDVLSLFDPTQLINGFYTIGLIVTDVNGEQASTAVTVEVDDDLKIGNFSITLEDISIPVAGIPITVTRTYDTRQRLESLDFGYGWSIDYQNVRVQENITTGFDWTLQSMGFEQCLVPGLDHRVSITLPDGRVEEFIATTNPECEFIIFPSIVQVLFEPLPGTFSTLEHNLGQGSVTGGRLIHAGDIGYFDPSAYTLTTVDNYVYHLNQEFGLTQVIDPNGNTLTYTDGGIFHSSGKSLTFNRDADDRITSITDPNGNVLTYDYDARGDLVSFTDAEGNMTTHTFDNGHRLIDYQDPRGITPLRNVYDENGRLIATIDAEGNRVEYTHDLDGNQEIIRDRRGNQTVYLYNDQGYVLSETNAEGESRSFTYDDRGNELTRVDGEGNTVTLTYNERDDVLTELDDLGNLITNTYDDGSRITSTTDANGNLSEFDYDGNGNLLQTITPATGTTDLSYDSSGNLLDTTDSLGNTTSFTYDSDGNRITETSADGTLTSYTFDENGNELTRETSRTDSDGNPVTFSTSMMYDANDQVIEITDAEGNTSSKSYNAIRKVEAETDALGRMTQYFYDSRGELTRTVYPDGTQETVTYDENGNESSRTDRNERTTTFVYDTANRLTTTVYPDGAQESTGYDDAGRVISNTDGNGNVTSYVLDAAGRRIQVTDALGNITQFTYDGNGNVLSMTDALGHTTSYEYDAGNRRILTTFHDGSTIQIAYDSLGRRISETDQAGAVTQFTYDELGRLLSVTDALNQVTSYSYDEQGNKLTQTDANGNTTSWAYDNLGRVIARTLPLGQIESFTYDAVGNRTEHVDFNGQTTTFTYDINNRLITKTFEDTTFEAWTYTSTGQVATERDVRGGITTKSYDERDRLIEVSNPDGTVLSYTYDNAGNRLTVTTPSGTTTYTFDVLNRLATVTDPSSQVTTYGYDAVGNRATLAYPNGTNTTYTYDDLNRLTQISHLDANSQQLGLFVYTLGPAGNRLNIADHTGRNVAYTYDLTYKLLSETVTDMLSVVTFETSYTYDAVGNRLTKLAGGLANTSYTYDDNDRLLTETLPTSVVNSYSYDDNGNTLSGPDGTYTFDQENQLIGGVTTSGSLGYEYDVDGLRIESSLDGVSTAYMLDKNRTYGQVLAEFDPAGDFVDTGLGQVTYVYGDDLISQERRGDNSFYHYDGLGSTRALSNGDGIVSDEYLFDAFGELLEQLGTTENRYLYTGEQYDANAGFYYLRARYLSTKNGRFIGMDALPGLLFEPLSLHRYLYVGANPVESIDPTGNLSLSGISAGFQTISISIAVRVTVFSLNFPRLGALAGFLLQVVFPSELVAGRPSLGSVFGGIDDVGRVATTQLVQTARVFSRNGNFLGQGNVFEETVGRILRIPKNGTSFSVQIPGGSAGRVIPDYINGRFFIEVKTSGGALKSVQTQRLAALSAQEGKELTFLFFRQPNQAQLGKLAEDISIGDPSGIVPVRIQYLFP